MARRRPQKAKQPDPLGLHEYAEHVADWVLRYKFTVLAVAAVVIGALVVFGVHHEEARGGETRAWERFSQSRDLTELRRTLGELEGTSAYPWAVHQLANGLYRQEEFEEARRVLAPLIDDPELDPYLKGYCLYTMGCIHLEEGHVAEAKDYLRKALTYGEESPFLRERVTVALGAVEEWPPVEWDVGASEGASEEGAGSPRPVTPAEETGAESEQPKGAERREITPLR